MLPVGLIGVAPGRAAALRAAGLDTLAGDAALAGRCRAVVVAGPEAERAARIREVIARGAHVFSAWPPAADAAGARALATVAEEAGVEVGVARPLAIGGVLARRPQGWRARIVSLSLAEAPARALPGAVDLCAALVGSRALAGLDAEAVGWPGAAALALRFRSGALATVALRAGPPALALSAVGPLGTVEADALDADGAPDPALAFVAAVDARRRPPASLHDAVGTLRIAERVLDRLGGC